MNEASGPINPILRAPKVCSSLDTQFNLIFFLLCERHAPIIILCCPAIRERGKILQEGRAMLRSVGLPLKRLLNRGGVASCASSSSLGRSLSTESQPSVLQPSIAKEAFLRAQGWLAKTFALPFVASMIDKSFSQEIFLQVSLSESLHSPLSSLLLWSSSSIDHPENSHHHKGRKRTPYSLSLLRSYR